MPRAPNRRSQPLGWLRRVGKARLTGLAADSVLTEMDVDGEFFRSLENPLAALGGKKTYFARISVDSVV